MSILTTLWPLTNSDRYQAWWGAHRYIGEADRLIPIQAVRPRYTINLAAGFSPSIGPAGASAAEHCSPAGPLYRINLRLNRAGVCAAWNANTLRQHTGAIVLSGGCRIRQWVRSILALIRAVPASGAKHPGRLQCRRRHSRWRFLIGGLLRLHHCRVSNRPQAPAPIEFRHQQTSRVLIAPNSRSAPPVEETGLDFRGGGAIRVGNVPPGNTSAIRLNTRPASLFNEPQPGDFPTLPQLLTSVVGGLIWLGLSLWPI